MPNSIISFLTAQMNRCIDGLRAGKRDAANELIRRAESRFRGLANQMYCRYRNVHQLADLDDVIVEAWMRLLASLQKVRPANTTKFFLFANVHIRRQLLDLARKAKSPKYHTQSLQCVGSGGGSASDYDPAESAARYDADMDLWERFHEAVERLPPPLHDVFTLVFYGDRGYHEVADMLGVHVRTVTRRWHDACEALKQLVGPVPGVP